MARLTELDELDCAVFTVTKQQSLIMNLIVKILKFEIDFTGFYKSFSGFPKFKIFRFLKILIKLIFISVVLQNHLTIIK